MATDKQKLAKLKRKQKRTLTGIGLLWIVMALSKDKNLITRIATLQNDYDDEQKDIIIEACKELVEKLSDTEDKVVL